MSEPVERVTSLPRLARRKREGHKGDFGRVLVVGGSRGMIGAVSLAANAALRGGAGLVTFAAPQPVQQTIASLCPCATSVALECDASGRLAAGAVRQVRQAAAGCDVLAVGPGMESGAVQQDLVRFVLSQPLPVVLDADGLNNLSAVADWPALRQCPLVLTPHPGEFARLTGRSVADIQAGRQAAVVAAARQWRPDPKSPPLVVVLKGAGTIITDGRRVHLNDTGNPGMATGGSGDVLTGLAAALIGQGIPPFEAACLAVHIHGRAGDLAAEGVGEVSLIASDLLQFLPVAISERAE